MVLPEKGKREKCWERRPSGSSKRSRLKKNRGRAVGTTITNNGTRGSHHTAGKGARPLSILFVGPVN